MSRCFKSLRWIILCLVTLGPLLPQKHCMRYLFKQQGMMLINLLYAMSGALTHKRYSTNFVLPEYFCLRFGILGAITLPFLVICLLRELAFATTHLMQVWKLLPVASLISLYPAFSNEAPVPNIMPLIPVAYSLAMCWACYPVIAKVLKRLDLPFRVVILLAAPLLNIMLIQLMPSEVLLERRDITKGLEYGTNMFYNHLLFKLPIFVLGCCAASIAQECSYKKRDTTHDDLDTKYDPTLTGHGIEMVGGASTASGTPEPMPNAFQPSEAFNAENSAPIPAASSADPGLIFAVSATIRKCVSSLGSSSLLLGAAMDGLVVLWLLVILYDPTSATTLYWFSNEGLRWTASYWTLLSSVLILVPFSLWMIMILAYEEHSRASLTYRMLSSVPLAAVLEGRADTVYALSYKLILYCYSAYARGEFLKGKGFLLYCFIALMVCHTTAKYVWRPLELWWRVYVETKYGQIRSYTGERSQQNIKQTGGKVHKTIGYEPSVVQDNLADDRYQKIAVSVHSALHASINWVADDTDKRAVAHIQSLSYQDGWEFFYKVFLAN